MSTENPRDDDASDGEFNEDGPGINGDLGSWLYVLCGVPLMIVFFVVLFGMIGSCDAQNILING